MTSIIEGKMDELLKNNPKAFLPVPSVILTTKKGRMHESYEAPNS